MANEKTPVVWDDGTKKHRPLGAGEKMGGLDASSILSSDSGNLIQTGSDGLAYLSGGGIADPRADNLLEESANGKLQVTADRIAEWLDGHPQDAAALADAINVVSGDEGNVVTAGSDSGAYLSASALADVFSGMSASDLQKLAAALADGKTVVASGGKLTVDPTSATAAQLSKISSAIRKSGGGLSVGADGKLSVDFASMDPAIMRAVVLSMVQQGGGIAVDQNGKLYVDFDSMPTDKFEAMMKSLKMLVPLDANKDLYVSTTNSAAGDTIVDGRGTAAKPFKTIQACVNYATSTYSVGRYHINIRVVAGTYNENVTLPDFSRGTGYIMIMADSGARDVIVNAQTNSAGARGWNFYATGGRWGLRRIDARRVENPTTAKALTTGCYAADGGGTELNLYGCSATQTMPASPSPLGGENYMVRLFFADSGGVLRIYHDAVAGAVSVQKPASGTPAVSAFDVVRDGVLWLTKSYDEDQNPVTTPNIVCSGSCDTFLRCVSGGKVEISGGGTLINFTGTVTGKRYQLTDGSFVSGVGSATYFPGDEAGTVEAETYCWYK